MSDQPEARFTPLSKGELDSLKQTRAVKTAIDILKTRKPEEYWYRTEISTNPSVVTESLNILLHEVPDYSVTFVDFIVTSSNHIVGFAKLERVIDIRADEFERLKEIRNQK